MKIYDQNHKIIKACAGHMLCSGLKGSFWQIASTLAAPLTLNYRLKACTYQLYCQQEEDMHKSNLRDQ